MGAAHDQSRPNIVFITCHDLGRHLGCYGHETVQSPALDRLSAQGVTFEQAFCMAPQCSPSRSALHTGRYPHANGVLGLAHPPFNWWLKREEQHMAQILAAAGYHTTLIGIQHVAQTAARLGFQRSEPVSGAREVGTLAARYWEEMLAQDAPIYLEVGFFEPHRPYDEYGVTPDESRGVEVLPYVPDVPEARTDFAALQGAIRMLDEGAAILLDAIDASGAADNTWLIFVADHGLAMPRAKGMLYDPGLEIALMMRWPARGLDGGRRVDALISNVDMTPTMLEALGIGIPSRLHGRSFWPLLTGGDYRPNAQVYAEKTYHTIYDPMRCVRTRTHKLIANFDTAPRIDVPEDVKEGALYPVMIPATNGVRPTIELYDLQADPVEQHNLAGHSSVRDVEAALKRNLWAWMEATDDPLLEHAFRSPQYRAAMDALSG